MFAYISNIYSSSQKFMPTNINNYLPSINFHFGEKKDKDNHMRMMVYTGAAMNRHYSF